MPCILDGLADLHGVLRADGYTVSGPTRRGGAIVLAELASADDLSHLPGDSVRTFGKSRYRQWLTHKLGTWHDQFGSSGCAGCGRCIVWCPVGIDLTEEVVALREEREAQGG